MSTKTDDKTRGAHAAPSARRLLSFNELRDRGITYSKVQIWRMVRAGRFPAPVKLGPSRSAFVEAEVDAWVEARMAERGNETPVEDARNDATKFRGRSHVVVGHDGVPCPGCGKATEIREHAAITEKILYQPSYYRRWFYCANPSCKVTTHVNPAFRVVRTKRP